MRAAGRLLLFTMLASACTAELDVVLPDGDPPFTLPGGRTLVPGTPSPSPTNSPTEQYVVGNGVATGYYTGNGSSMNEIDIDDDFVPALVIVQTAGPSGVLALSNQGLASKRVDTGVVETGILVADNNGFVAAGPLSAVGKIFYWIAIQRKDAIAEPGSYAGADRGPLVVTPPGATYASAGAFLSPTGNSPVAVRTLNLTGNSPRLDGGGPIPNYLTVLETTPDGSITTGTAASIMGETYYYVSFAELPSALIATTYSVSGNNGNFALGFQPDAVLVQSVDQTREVYFKSRFMEPDDTHRLDGVVSTTALTLGANGFGWATDTGVAANGTYWVLAIRTGM